MSNVGRILIEMRDLSGTWVQVDTCINDSQSISSALRQAKERFADRTVRAVNEDGRVVDII
jgi:hypothetical protein